MGHRAWMHLWMVGRLNIRPLIERNRVSSNAQTGLGGLSAKPRLRITI